MSTIFMKRKQSSDGMCKEPKKAYIFKRWREWFIY